MLKPAKRQITIPIVENSAAFGVPSQLIGSSDDPEVDEQMRRAARSAL